MQGVTTVFSNKLEFKGAVIGMLLGDACIPKIQRGINAHIRIGHSIKQEQYLLHKREILEFLTECRICYQKRATDDRGGDYVTLDSKVHPFYTKLREHLYFEGRKTIDEHIMKCLTPRGLAYWYQDDGCLTNHSDFLTPFLCTHGFSKTEVEMMCRMLQKQFGLQWRVRKDKQYYAMRLRRMDREAFFDLIKPYMHECMLYKIRDDGKTITQKDSVDIECIKCKKTFSVLHKNRNRKYCSCKCYHESKMKNV